MTERCPLCGCECTLTTHHLVPRQVSRSNKYPKALKTDADNIIMICRQCHDNLHAVYSNQELRDRLNTLEALMSDEKISAFSRWRNKHPGFNGHSKMSNSRR